MDADFGVNGGSFSLCGRSRPLDGRQEVSFEIALSGSSGCVQCRPWFTQSLQ